LIGVSNEEAVGGAGEVGKARFAPDAPTTWEALAPFLEKSGSNSFVRNLVRAVAELYGNGEPTITRGNWETLDAAVRGHHGQPGWCKEVLHRAGMERLITTQIHEVCAASAASRRAELAIRGSLLVAVQLTSSIPPVRL
jgi:hypothetical protein